MGYTNITGLSDYNPRLTFREDTSHIIDQIPELARDLRAKTRDRLFGDPTHTTLESTFITS
jgi:hypothetical protein